MIRVESIFNKKPTRNFKKEIFTEKLAVVTLYSYFPALLDHTMSIACELVSKVKAMVTMDLTQEPQSHYNKELPKKKKSNLLNVQKNKINK